jgi:hypothetical protein
MVADTLLPEHSAPSRRRAALRKIAMVGGGVLLALAALLAYYCRR